LFVQKHVHVAVYGSKWLRFEWETDIMMIV